MARRRESEAMQLIKNVWDAEARSGVLVAIVECVNKSLEIAAKRVEDLSLYDYDESTRYAAAEAVRSVKLELTDI